MAVGVPSEIGVVGDVPPDGIRLTRSYLAPLPADAAATLAYFDPELAAWRAVPSTVAPDRRSVSAVVHHLSLWTDFVSGTRDVLSTIQDKLADAADWSYYQIGKVFDTRVDPPHCSDGQPEWVKSAVFIETHRNNSVLFCVGEDSKQPKLLTIKARVNRGFGFNAASFGEPSWSYNSTFDKAQLAEAIDVVAELDQTLAASVREVTSGGRMTGPGEEYSIGISESEVRKLKDNLVLRMSPQPVLPFLATTLGQLVGTDLTLKADGYIAAAMALATCGKDIKEATDGATATKAAIACITGVDEQLARQLAQFLLKQGVKDAGKVAGKIMGKMTVYLALIGPVFSGMNYWAERSLPDAAHTVHVFPQPTPPPALLLTAAGLGSYAFGAPEADVLTMLTARLGKPTLSGGVGGCEAAGAGYQNYADFGRLRVRFAARDDSSKSPRTLESWNARMTVRQQDGLKLDPAIPFGLTLKQLQAKYPDGGGLEHMDAWFAAGVYLIPPLKLGEAETIHAGDLDWCT